MLPKLSAEKALAIVRALKERNLTSETVQETEQGRERLRHRGQGEAPLPQGLDKRAQPEEPEFTPVEREKTRVVLTAQVGRIARFLFLLFVYASVAAVAFDGFYQKWGFRDDERRYSFEEMLNGTAHRPFVYRQLLPKLAQAFNDVLPDKIQQKLGDILHHRNWWERKSFVEWLYISPSTHNNYFIQYIFIYFSCYSSMIISMFVMRNIALTVELDSITATIAPVLFAISFQYFLSMGGYFYDFTELLFFSVGILAALKNLWWLMLPISAIAEYNKESYVFFILTLFPFFCMNNSLRRSLLIVVVITCIAILTYLVNRAEFADNPGHTAESWMWESIKFYLTVNNLFQLETNWGVLTPRAYSIVTFTLIGILLYRGWRQLLRPCRDHILMAAAINGPLVLVFCGPGEMRNFSLCYMALFFLIAKNVKLWIANPVVVWTPRPPPAHGKTR